MRPALLFLLFASMMIALTPPATAAEPEEITLQAGQRVTTKTVFKKGSKYKVEVSGAVTTPLSGGGTYVSDAFYGVRNDGGPDSGSPEPSGAGLFGKAWGYEDTLERYTTTRRRPAYNSAGAYSIVLDAVEDGTMELIATSGGGGSGQFSIRITPPGTTTTPGDVVTVSGVSRKVEVSRSESGWEPGTNGLKLNKLDRVHTGFRSGVILTFPGGSRLLVGAMTLLQITDVASGPAGGVRARVLLKTGAVSAQINRSTGARGDFQVKTPTSTASVRGTTFSVAYDGTATTVRVTEGKVAVTAKNGATAIAEAGQETRSTAKSVSRPVPSSKGFKSGGLSSSGALKRMTAKLATGLKRCKLTVVSNKLAPTRAGWSGRFVIVKAGQGIDAKPKGTARVRLKRRRVSGGNALGRRILSGCRA